MRTIEVDANQRELSPHGTLLYPLEINHDDLSTFQNGFVRCHWHEELELSIVRSGRACYTLGGGVHVLQAGEGILINANVPHTSAPFGSENAVLLTVIVHPAFLYGLPGSVIESRLMRPFLASRRLSAVPLTAEETQNVLAVDEFAQRRPFAWELKSKSLLCDLFYSLLARSRDELCEDAPLSEEALARLDGMLAALHAHFGEAIDLAALARQACLSREDCCRFFQANDRTDHFAVYGNLPRRPVCPAFAGGRNERHRRSAAMRLQQRRTFLRRLLAAHARHAQGLPAPVQGTFYPPLRR